MSLSITHQATGQKEVVLRVLWEGRPVKRLIQRELVNKLAREILEGKVHKDSAIEVDCVDGQTVLRNR